MVSPSSVSSPKEHERAHRTSRLKICKLIMWDLRTHHMATGQSYDEEGVGARRRKDILILSAHAAKVLTPRRTRSHGSHTNNHGAWSKTKCMLAVKRFFRTLMKVKRMAKDWHRDRHRLEIGSGGHSRRIYRPQISNVSCHHAYRSFQAKSRLNLTRDEN